MGIVSSFTTADLQALTTASPAIVEEEIIRALSYLGEQCVIRIRDRSGLDSWFDQTGNLRSSIGYVVYKNGITMVESDFKQVKDGSDGVSSGKKAVIDLATKYSDNSYALIILAGMEYAEYVEAMEKKDVLASTEIWARSKVKGLFDNALQRAQKRIEKLMTQLGL